MQLGLLVLTGVPPGKFGRVGSMNVNHAKFICLVKVTFEDWCALNGYRWLIRFEDCGFGTMKKDSEIGFA